MKKILCVLCALLVSIGLVSCGDSAASKGPRKIGVLTPTPSHGWVGAVNYYANQRCTYFHEEDNVEAKVLASSNAEEMTAQLDELLAWGADVIVCYPQWTGMEVPIANALKQGVKIVNFDIEIKVEDPNLYLVTGDNEGMGRGCATFIYDKAIKDRINPADAVVVALTVPTSGSVSELRYKGFKEVMDKKAPGAKIIERATKFTREDGLKDFADILTAVPHIDAVFSMDDETSIGVYQALKEAKRTDVRIITGGGGMQEYYKLMEKSKEDPWLMSASYTPGMISDAMDVALKLLNGKTDLPHRVIIPTFTTTYQFLEFGRMDNNCPY